MQYVACDANASFNSNKSMSFKLSPALLTASGMAMDGPMPIMAGSTPTTLYDLNIPNIGKFRLSASLLVIISAAEAPSVTFNHFIKL